MIRFPRLRVGKTTVVRGQQRFPQPQPVGGHTSLGILAFCRGEVGRRGGRGGGAIGGHFTRQGRKFCAPFTALFVAGSGWKKKYQRVALVSGRRCCCRLLVWCCRGGCGQAITYQCCRWIEDRWIEDRWIGELGVNGWWRRRGARRPEGEEGDDEADEERRWAPAWPFVCRG